MAKQIPLTQGQFAIVDDEDFENLNAWKWFAQWSPTVRTFYAVRNTKAGINKQRPIFMHRQILSLGSKDPRLVDHVNPGNGLDNRRLNLRIATDRGNNGNSRIRKDNGSGFKGVCFHKGSKKWVAQIGRKGSRKHLGLYVKKSEAARAYDRAAIRYFGKFARLNFPKGEP